MPACDNDLISLNIIMYRTFILFEMNVQCGFLLMKIKNNQKNGNQKIESNLAQFWI